MLSRAGGAAAGEREPRRQWRAGVFVVAHLRAYLASMIGDILGSSPTCYWWLVDSYSAGLVGLRWTNLTGRSDRPSWTPADDSLPEWHSEGRGFESPGSTSFLNSDPPSALPI